MNLQYHISVSKSTFYSIRDYLWLLSADGVVTKMCISIDHLFYHNLLAAKSAGRETRVKRTFSENITGKNWSCEILYLNHCKYFLALGNN